MTQPKCKSNPFHCNLPTAPFPPNRRHRWQMNPTKAQRKQQDLGAEEGSEEGERLGREGLIRTLRSRDWDLEGARHSVGCLHWPLGCTFGDGPPPVFDQPSYNPSPATTPTDHQSQRKPGAGGTGSGGNGGATGGGDGSEAIGNADAARTVLRVKQKLEGVAGGEGEPLGVAAQVDVLLAEARDPELLCRMFVGWGAWM